jgi:DNA-binding NarL/FixJ family response regulator
LERKDQAIAQKGCSSAKGDNHGMAKLSSEEVRIIKKLLPKMTNNKIADIFKVSPATISAIRVGRTWNDV